MPPSSPVKPSDPARISLLAADPADAASAELQTTRSRRREDIDDRYKWNLTDIFFSWEAWDTGYKQLEAGIERYAALKGTLAGGAERLLEAFRLSEELGQLAYRVWYFPSLRYDEDQRDNTVNAKRQQVQILFARWKQAESWFNPELLEDSRSRPCARGWTPPSRCGSIASRSRTSIASRSTCSTRRASA